MERKDELKLNLAKAFAAYRHKDQKRKYTNEPYFNHCKEVAGYVASVTEDVDMICAAYLHDTIEDTATLEHEIYMLFGERVCNLVLELTDISKPEDGNREARKKIDREHIWRASKDGQVIKLADMISNTSSISKYDPNFAKVYLEEKRLLLEGMHKDLPLYNMAFLLANQPLNLEDK